jgi:hypothetical protein
MTSLHKLLRKLRARRPRSGNSRVAHRACALQRNRCAQLSTLSTPSARLKRVAAWCNQTSRRRLTEGDGGGVHSPPWYRRRTCRGIHDVRPCRIGSAREWGVGSRCTSRLRSTAASSAAPSIRNAMSVCAIKRAERLRVRSRCCVSCVSSFPRLPSTLKRS